MALSNALVVLGVKGDVSLSSFLLLKIGKTSVDAAAAGVFRN